MNVVEHYMEGLECRHYHNINHAIRVVKAASEICKGLYISKEDYYSVVLAAKWHDAVYVPGATDNEELSAIALLEEHPDQDVAANLIRRTTITDHLSETDDFLLQILLDADISGLGGFYNRFRVDQGHIMQEHGSSDCSKQASFLMQFLDKPFIYRTSYGQKHWETTARENILNFYREMC